MNSQLISIFKLLIVSLLMIMSTAKANNGSLARAYPVKSIVVDGDPSDWSQVQNQYPLIESFGGSQEGYSAYYKAAYKADERALYLLLVVEEAEHYVADTTKSPWQTQDTHIVYLKPEHEKPNSSPLFFASNGNKVIHRAQTSGWDPKAIQLPEESTRVVTKRLDSTTIYEWRIVLEDNISPGTVIGIDHIVIDFDGVGA